LSVRLEGLVVPWIFRIKCYIQDGKKAFGLQGSSTCGAFFTLFWYFLIHVNDVTEVNMIDMIDTIETHQKKTE